MAFWGDGTNPLADRSKYNLNTKQGILETYQKICRDGVPAAYDYLRNAVEAANCSSVTRDAVEGLIQASTMFCVSDVSGQHAYTVQPLLIDMLKALNEDQLIQNDTPHCITDGFHDKGLIARCRQEGDATNGLSQGSSYEETIQTYDLPTLTVTVNRYFGALYRCILRETHQLGEEGSCPAWKEEAFYQLFVRLIPHVPLGASFPFTTDMF